MNRSLLLAVFLVSSCISWAQIFIKEPKDSTAYVEFNDGRQWVYRQIDGLTVGMANEEFKDNYANIIRLAFS